MRLSSQRELTFDPWACAEAPAGPGGLMDELLELMTQLSDANGSDWQHPSDLSRSNFQRRFGTDMAPVSLGEWRGRRGGYPRFRGVPKIFQRTPCP
ncbi:S100P-binding protein-like [Menidia menidia]